MNNTLTSKTRTNKKLSYADDVDFKHSRSLKVTHCCANRRGIYMTSYMALNSNLTSNFNRS